MARRSHYKVRRKGSSIPLRALPDAIIKDYKRKHWGIEATKAVRINRADLPDYLTEMGKLRGFILRDEQGGELELLIDKDPKTLLCFESGKSQTLFCTADKGLQAEVREHFWANNDSPVYSFKDVCYGAGGRQAKLASRHCPSKRVRVMGRAQDILYSTHKRGDGPSTYIHRFGEDGGKLPYLCCDTRGDLFLAGGSYIVTDHGIED